WSPSGRFLSYTAFLKNNPSSPIPGCKVYIVRSMPPTSNDVPEQFTFPPDSVHDYDPAWSSLNTIIAFDRRDKYIYGKAVPWVGDTALALITTSNNCVSLTNGDAVPAISPDGRWVAFSRCNAIS